MGNDRENIIAEFIEFISDKTFSCIGAKAAMAKDQLKFFVSGNMACPTNDKDILDFLYDFIDSYRKKGGYFHSAAILFTGPGQITETIFENILWQRLQAISDMDAEMYNYDKRVSADPASHDFSFSLKEEAFFIIAMHPASSRASRRFAYPALVFNPHAQFEEMKEKDKYESMKETVRKRDILYSGSVNPMVDDYGRSSETTQYSGKNYNEPWECPLKIKHDQ
ncbi:MAG TPA: guanitoxin biosynthesis heme-dependent pre-guanitoxin N-hydroxylase GntA [Chitinophagaceae bacterium]|nr:guanitoxin biosynthesis heme-dependent pre-guanitoxin N-hydroxylase GntA [Chitinophagaceae bacterium]